MKKLFTPNTFPFKTLLYPCLLMGLAAQAQDSKSTGEVQLLANLSAEVSMTEEQVTLTLNGSANQWFAIGFGASNMASGTDVAFYATIGGETTLYDGRLPGQGTPVVDQGQDWELISNTVDGSVRSIVATRPLNTNDPDDFVFDFNASTLQVIYSHATSASTALAYHGGNRGAQLLEFSVVASTAGISKLEDNMVLYPNPASNEVKLRVEEQVQLTSVHIYDVQARLLESLSVGPIGNELRIPLNGFAPGIYYLEANTSNDRAVLRFVVE